MDAFGSRVDEHGVNEPAARTAGEPGVGVVLHAEQLRAGVERVEAGTVQVRKRIVMEELTVTVPVRREVVDVVRVYADGSEEILEIPASLWVGRVEDRSVGADRSNGDTVTVLGEDGPVSDVEDGPQALADGAHRTSVVLHEERPVITTEVFAYEQLNVDVIAAQETVSIVDDVRREDVEVDLPGMGTGTGTDTDATERR